MKPRSILENPNSSGQGTSPLATEHFFHDTVTGEGYTYSHTTPIGLPSGDWYLMHTFKNSDHHTVSLRSNPETGLCSLQWFTSCSTSSGHQMNGSGRLTLKKHLQSKRYRYKFTRATA